MNKEIKSTEDALLLRLGQIVKENVELEQRVHQLTDDYNDVVRQLQGQKKRKNEYPARQTLGEMFHKCELCDKDKLKAENKGLKTYTRVINVFMKDKGYYMPKGKTCTYVHGNPDVSSLFCLECESCLRVFDDLGVVCQQHLNRVIIDSVNSCPPHQDNP